MFPFINGTFNFFLLRTKSKEGMKKDKSKKGKKYHLYFSPGTRNTHGKNDLLRFESNDEKRILKNGQQHGDVSFDG
jgi:hypothetical protein